MSPGWEAQAKGRARIGRLGRRGLLLSALAGCTSAETALGQTLGIRAQRLELPEAGRRNGEIEVLGALELTGGGSSWGGISGVLIEPDLRVTAITDRARFVTGRLVLDGGGRPTDLADVVMGALGDASGQPLAPGAMGDAEGLARLPDGRMVVAFERFHRLRVYPRGLAGPGVAFADPPGIDRQRPNLGIEGLTTLPDGRLFAHSESLVRGPGWEKRIWLGGEAGWTGVWKRTVETFAAADATALPDGSVLLLERSHSLLSGFRARIERLDATLLAQPREGAVLQGTEIARFDAPPLAENYEAIAALPWSDGRMRILLISDDNFSLLQRTLLLWLAWDPGASP